MDEIEVDKSNRFIKLFPCVECKLKSKGLEKHKKHFESQYEADEYTLNCLFNNCDYNTNTPKDLMTHFGQKHGKSIENIK